MQVITTTAALEQLCHNLRHDEFVTVDTEFMREKTFWAKLCLIQIAGAEHQAIIDPLANGISLDSFFDLMANENVIKVFHAARQDIEIIYHLSGKIPHPLFDSQVAAMVCGFGDQIGYEPLARSLAGATIDKSSRFTDWSRRPLTEKQLEYALSDVTHLRVIYEKLKQRLDSTGRASWLDEEMDILTHEDTYRADPVDAWKRVKFRHRKKRQTAILMEVAAWRERTAQSRDIPRNRVLKDDGLGELAMQAPTSIDAMLRLRAVPKGLANSRGGEAIVKAVKAGMQRDLDDVPEIVHTRRPQGDGVTEIAEILKLALKIISEQNHIAARLIANAADIEAIAAFDNPDVKAMKGWRRKIFGETALKLKTGMLAIGLRNGKAAIFTIADECERLRAAE